MIARLLTAVLLAVAALSLPAAAQVAPASNFTDMWYLPSESGWGVSFTQHTGSNQVFAVWYTYDPRQPDPASPGGFKPLWIVMPGGTWTTPTSITGPVFVTNGQPFTQTGSNTQLTQVGSFTFSFASAQAGTFAYSIAVPAGLASSDPAFGLPSMSGSKSIQRQSF
jgi:hypothetical protein